MDTTRSLTANGPGEALSAIALFLNVSSVVAFTVCLATFGTGSATLGVILGAVAVGMFGVSLGCFVIDGHRWQQANLDGSTPEL
jgi:hypothetical protein